MDDNVYFLSITFVAMLVNFGFFCLLYFIKELQAHPMQLFMFIAASDQIVIQQYLGSLFTCDLRLHELFAATVYFDTSCENKQRAVKNLFDSTSNITMGMSWSSIMLQCCLCLDLIFTLTRPFAKKEARMPAYITISAALGFF